MTHPVEWEQPAGHPPAHFPGGNPPETQPDPSSISGSRSNTPDPNDPAVSWKIAQCMHWHHDGIGAEIPADTEKAWADLKARTWDTDREMSRDEKRLYKRYMSIIADHKARFHAEAFRKWLDCPKCSKHRP